MSVAMMSASSSAVPASTPDAHIARHGADFGVRITGAIDIDMKAVKARKDKVSRDARTNVE